MAEVRLMLQPFLVEIVHGIVRKKGGRLLPKQLYTCRTVLRIGHTGLQN